MAEFVVGQWVECVEPGDFGGVVLAAGFHRVKDAGDDSPDIHVEGLGLSWNKRRFRPVSWQVGRTCKTTLEGVTATITGIEGHVIRGVVANRSGGVVWDIDGTGRCGGCNLEDKTAPHLTPYLADPEPSKSEDEAQGIAAIVGKWSGDESDEEIEREIESVLSDGACEVVGRFLIVQDADNPALFGVRDTEKNKTAWVRGVKNAQEVLRDARAGKADRWCWANDVFDAAPPSRYHRTINGVTLDLYDIAEAWGVESHRVFHAVKKLVMAGRRGHKDREQDLREAIASIESELRKMKGGA